MRSLTRCTESFSMSSGSSTALGRRSCARRGERVSGRSEEGERDVEGGLAPSTSQPPALLRKPSHAPSPRRNSPRAPSKRAHLRLVVVLVPVRAVRPRSFSPSPRLCRTRLTPHVHLADLKLRTSRPKRAPRQSPPPPTRSPRTPSPAETTRLRAPPSARRHAHRRPNPASDSSSAPPRPRRSPTSSARSSLARPVSPTLPRPPAAQHQAQAPLPPASSTSSRPAPPPPASRPRSRRA